MRFPHPLILGAGPAGCAAAITFAASGRPVTLLDRDAEVGDAICGGFLSWRTAETLRELGVDPASLGAANVTSLGLFANGREVTLDLPHPAFGLSRRALDTALRARAVELGADLRLDTIRSIENGVAIGKNDRYEAPDILLATGKHDVRGEARPRAASDPALGIRVRLRASSDRIRALSGRIELHLFEGGYAGIVLQEGGSTNICLALKKSALSAENSDPQALLAHLASRSPALAYRLGSDWRDASVDTIGSVPYGFIARHTRPHLYRLGDQAAVIPSLAGEGIAMALTSGVLAAQKLQDSRAFQTEFAGLAKPPITLARQIRNLAENPFASRSVLIAARMFPGAVASIAERTRIAPPPSLASAPPSP